MLQRVAGLRRQHQAGAARQAGERLGGFFQHLRHRAAVGGNLAFDAGALVLGEVADLQQAVDAEAQAKVGRQAPGGGVRREQQAEVLEVRHTIAYGRTEEQTSELQSLMRSSNAVSCWKK